MPVSASRTSSSLNGLIMAMTSFMEIPHVGPFVRSGRTGNWGSAAAGEPRPALPAGRESSGVPTGRIAVIALQRMAVLAAASGGAEDWRTKKRQLCTKNDQRIIL